MFKARAAQHNVRELMESLRTSVLLAVCLVLVSGCASSSLQSQASSEAIEAKADSDFNAYLSCMKTAAVVYAKSTATPHEIADAAQARCNAEFNAWDRSVELRMTHKMQTAKGVDTARRSAHDTVQEFKGRTKEKVVQWVIELRLQNK